MKMNMKSILTFALLLCAFAAQAAPGVGSVNFGITNAILARNTTYTNKAYNTNMTTTIMGGLGSLSTLYNSTVGLVATGTSVVTNATTCTYTVTLLPGDEDGNIADVTSTPPFSWTITAFSTGADGNAPITNTFRAVTNVPAAYVGANGSLHLYTLAVGASVTVTTNFVLKAKLKNLIAPQP